jgi:hypothetical protein
MGRLYFLSTAFVFIQAIPKMTTNRYTADPRQKAIRTDVLLSPFSLTNANIAIMTIQIVNKIKARMMLI